MLLTLRHEWRLESTEKYPLDSLLGVSWERVFQVGAAVKSCWLWLLV